MSRSLMVVIGISIAAIAAFGWYHWQFRTALFEEQSRLHGILEERDRVLGDRDAALVRAGDQIQSLTDSLRTEMKKNESFERQIRKISGTVGDLEKLSKTDPELLAKYSKIFFLNENYEPSRLADIPASLVSPVAVRTPLLFHGDALPYLESMLEAAAEDGVTVQVLSAFRSFYTQGQLKSSYKVTYGSGANAFSADQGYSEHQLGTTVDLTTPSVGGTFTGFDKTEAYAWLVDNAYRYGFILSYPAGNAYYQYEPWHWRFVGKDLARDLHRQGKAFYEMDQRELDTYLISLFD